jgi:hypothetical protein
MASIFSKTQSKGYTDTGGYNTAKPTYKSPITKPAQGQQTQEGGAYAEYMKELQAIQQQRQEEYNRIMQDRANALVKWQQEQAALRAQEQTRMQQSRRFGRPSYNYGTSVLEGNQGLFAGIGDFLRDVLGTQVNSQSAGGGTVRPQPSLSMNIPKYDLGKPSYVPSTMGAIEQPSGNFDYETYPYPYTPTGMATEPAVAEEEQGWGGGGGYGYPELPYYDYGGGLGGYDPYTDKPSYRNSVGGIYWRI